MRITRKSPQGLKAGGIFQVYENDFYNNADDEETAADAKASSETEWRSLRGPRVSEQELGFEQVQRAWIYLLSEKQAPDTPEIERRKGG